MADKPAAGEQRQIVHDNSNFDDWFRVAKM